jgi:anti-sigma B factor antagonist
MNQAGAVTRPQRLFAEGNPTLTVTEPSGTTVIRVHRAARTELHDPDDLLILSLDGELDVWTADAFTNQLTAAAGEAAGPDVLLDLGRLYFLDSAGLLALTEAASALDRAGRRLSLASVRPRVREFLAYSGAEALVPVFPTIELAREHARAARGPQTI